jgi:PAS domain S-box-containing protein
MRSSPGDLRNRTPRHRPAKLGVSVCLFRLAGAPTPKISRAGRSSAEPPAQGRNKRREPRKLLLLLLGVFLLFQSPARAQTREVRRVLILNVLGPLSSPGVAAMDQAIVTGLEQSEYQIELYSEDLEATLFPDEASQRQFREWYIRKYRDRRPDVIIAVGLEPLRFMVESHERFFPGIPIIFCGSTEEMLENLKLDSHFTGVWAVAQPEKTLNAALALQPGTKHVVVVGGVGAYDRQLEAIAKESFRKYESRFEFTYLTDFGMPALLERLKRLPDHTIVYHTSIMQDADGMRFIDANQSVPLVASSANAPVFVVDDADLGKGAVGGYLLSFAVIGHVVAQMVVRVLKGEKPQDIPIVKSADAYMFDWRALKRWGLKESGLPPGSIVLNRQPTVWESYKSYIIGGISLILVQTLLIFALGWQRAQRRKTETALAIMFDRLRLAMEAARSAGWDWDVKSGRDQRFGDLETIFGIPSDTYSGHIEDFRRSVHPEESEYFGKAIAEARQSRKPYVAEFRVVRADGTVRWITARGKFYYAPNGDPERMLGMAVDITDRKDSEHKLRESQDRLAGIVGSAMDAIIAIDEQQRIVLFNTAAEKMFGCARGDAVGATIDRFIPQRFRPTHGAHIRRFGESGGTTRAMGALSALWAVRTNGQEFPIEASISHTKSDGRKLFTAIIRDITERHRSEEAVRESEQRFRLVANTAPVMIWMSGPDKLCNYFNQPWLEFTGRPLETELGKGWSEGVHPEDLTDYLDIYTRAFDLRESFKMQYRLRRHDGEYRWVLDIGVPRLNLDGSFDGFIGSCIDITDRKLAEEALADVGRRLIEAHEEERTWIARELHDDINQRIALLTVQLGIWAQHPPNSGVEVTDYIRDVRQSLSDLGNDIQSLSHRLHSSKLEYLGLAAAAGGFCSELSERQKVEIEFVHAGISRTLPKEISLCMFRVLQEALQNAVKHSGERHFSVELQGTSGEIQLTVNDSGVGFDQQDAMNRRGLGLISMRERLRLVGGEFSIESKPGHGTTIRARVPLVAQAHRSSATG